MKYRDAQYVAGFDLSKGPDYIGISSDEYKRLKECEQELEKLQKEVEKTPKFQKNKHSVFIKFCNDCNRETEHEQIIDENDETIESVTTCLICGENNADIDFKTQLEEVDSMEGEKENGAYYKGPEPDKD